MNPEIKIIETPRDGLQGIVESIPTAKKVAYINQLLKCGFNTVEVGSFVSPKAIPQWVDTADVLRQLDYKSTSSKIAVLVANLRGAQEAVKVSEVDQLFYPFALSSTFLRLNLNTNFVKAEQTIEDILNLCNKQSKELVVFLSLAFGNPYGDEWNIGLVHKWVERLESLGVKTMPLADTIGDIKPEQIYKVFSEVVPAYTQTEFGFHTHAYPGKGIIKVDAAYRAGIRRFDTVLGGLGGCPMTGKKMVGNLALSELLAYCNEKQIDTSLQTDCIKRAEQFPLLS